MATGDTPVTTDPDLNSLVNRDGRAKFYPLREANDVPIRQADAAMTGRSPNSLRLVCSMQTDALFIDRNPDHAHRTVRSRRKHVEIAASLAMFEHRFVVAKLWQFRDATDL